MTGHPCWGLLSEEGRRLWGDIFTDGQVPIQGIQTGLTLLGDKIENTEVRLIALEALTSEQYDKLTRRIADHARPRELHPSLHEEFLNNVRREIQKNGLPIREDLIDFVMIKDPQRWFG